jgi:hypothetical protein
VSIFVKNSKKLDLDFCTMDDEKASPQKEEAERKTSREKIKVMSDELS